MVFHFSTTAQTNSIQDNVFIFKQTKKRLKKKNKTFNVVLLCMAHISGVHLEAQVCSRSWAPADWKVCEFTLLVTGLAPWEWVLVCVCVSIGWNYGWNYVLKCLQVHYMNQTVRFFSAYAALTLSHNPLSNVKSGTLLTVDHSDQPFSAGFAKTFVLLLL